MRYCTLLHPVRRGLNCAFPPLMPHGFPVKFRAKCKPRHRARCITPYRYSCVLRRYVFLSALEVREARARTARKFIIICCTKVNTVNANRNFFLTLIPFYSSIIVKCTYKYRDYCYCQCYYYFLSILSTRY